MNGPRDDFAQMDRHYFSARLRGRSVWFWVQGMNRRDTTMHKATSDARLQVLTRRMSDRSAELINTLAVYGALAFIAAIILGTVSVHS